ncbi:hypothetical protein VTJ04DRAFT_1081 [Mycothermus thermophilus]|uniref:uncharacterized protein n=1 Tax=Humicola insolens TaxID=85995 RepID=UPI00374330BB
MCPSSATQTAMGKRDEKKTPPLSVHHHRQLTVSISAPENLSPLFIVRNCASFHLCEWYSADDSGFSSIL